MIIRVARLGFAQSACHHLFNSKAKMYRVLSWICVNVSQRWVFAVMCFLGLFHAYAMRACLSITMTEMIVPIESEVFLDDVCLSPNVETNVKNNTTTNDLMLADKKYAWDEYTQGILLSSFYYGYVITHLPGGSLAEKYGGKHIYGLGIFLTAVFTLLTPISITWADSDGLMAMRVLMGLGEGITYPAINCMLAQWAPPEERSRMGTFVYSGQLLGTIYANTVCGLILQYFKNWSTVFYVMGGVSAIWYIFWLILCYNNSREHPFISQKEFNFLNEKLSEHTHEKPPPIPWRHVLRSKPMWATIVGMIGFNWSILTIVTDLPKYMSSVLKLSVENNGYLNSVIYISMWIGSIITSWLADFIIKSKYLPTVNVRKIGSILCLFCSACFVVAASYAGCDEILVTAMFVAAMGLMGTAYPSIMINTLDLSPNYSGTLMALSNGISAGVTGILSPYLISRITPNQTLMEWRLVFWILFAVSCVTNIIFLYAGKGEVEYWNDPKFDASNDNVESSGSYDSTENVKSDEYSADTSVTHI